MMLRKTSRRNLAASSVVAIIVLIAVCVGFLHVLTDHQAAISEIEAGDLARTEKIATLMRQISENQRMLSETLTAAAAHRLDEEQVFHLGREVIDFVRTAEKRFAELRPFFADDGDDLAEIFGVTAREFQKYRGTVVDVVEISTVDVGLAATQMLKATASYVRLVEDISQAADLSNDQTLADMNRMRSGEQRDIRYMLAGSVIAVTALLLASFAFYTRMQRAEAERIASERLQKELESQLLHSQRLEALGTLAGGISHELNNTLVPVIALAQLVHADLPEHSPLRDDLGSIIVAGKRARDLVGRILAFSRKQELVKQPTDLTAVTSAALRLLRATLPATISLVQELAEVPPVLGDAGQLQQVIVNLVANAAQAIGDNPGTITVRLSLRPAETVSGSQTVELAIADTGCGMDQETRERMFEPFYTTKEVGKGTGLGLSVVHGIVSHHGGDIEVQSAPGEGTTFTIRFAVIDQPQHQFAEALAA